MYRSRYRHRYNIDSGTGHVRKIGATSTRYRTIRYVWHDINPIPPHCDVISWSFGSRRHSKPHTPGSPSISSTLGIPRVSAHAQWRKFPRMRWPPTVMPPLLVAGNLRELTHTSAGGRHYRRGRGKESRVGDVACAYCVQLAHGRRVRVAGADDLSRWMVSRCGPVFGGKGRVKPHICTRLACMSNRSTRSRRIADNPKGVFYLLNSIPRPRKQEKILKIYQPIILHFNDIPQRVSPANTGFSLYMYRQFMPSLCT